jgi:MraZ protein
VVDKEAVELSVLMGHAPAKVDEKGRIKVPTAFRRVIEERYGTECFTTSFEGEKARIYPLAVWREFQERLAKVPSTSAAKDKLQKAVNYFGQMGSIDAQGRLLVPQILRDVAKISGEVVVLGKEDHLEVWNSERIATKVFDEPVGLEDFKELELHGV